MNKIENLEIFFNDETLKKAEELLKKITKKEKETEFLDNFSTLGICNLAEYNKENIISQDEIIEKFGNYKKWIKKQAHKDLLIFVHPFAVFSANNSGKPIFTSFKDLGKGYKDLISLDLINKIDMIIIPTDDVKISTAIDKDDKRVFSLVIRYDRAIAVINNVEISDLEKPCKMCFQKFPFELTGKKEIQKVITNFRKYRDKSTLPYYCLECQNILLQNLGLGVRKIRDMIYNDELERVKK